MRPQQRLQGRHVGPDDRPGDFPFLEHDKRRHRRDAARGGGRSRGAVDVDLQELDRRVRRREPLEDGGDHLAGAAPLGEEVDGADARAGQRVELGRRRDSDGRASSSATSASSSSASASSTTASTASSAAAASGCAKERSEERCHCCCGDEGCQG